MKKSSEELLQELQEVDALIAKKQPLTGKERQRLKEIRERGFLANIREGAIQGQSLKQTISQNFKAQTVGIKEKFNPLNIAKSLVGKTGASLLGKTFGASKDTMKYFLGDKKSSMSLSSNRKLGSVDTAFYTTVTSGQKEGLRKGNSVADVAGKLFNLVKNHNEKNKLGFELQRNFEQELHEEDERRHKELIEQIKKSQTAKLGKIKKEPKISSGKIKKISKEESEVKPTTPSAPSKPTPTTSAPTPAKPTTTTPTTPSAPAKPTPTPTTPAPVKPTPTTPSAPAPAKPTTPSVPAPAKPTTTTPTTPATPTTPSAPAPAKPVTPTATKPVAPTKPSVTTATKIATGAAAISTGGLLMPSETVAAEIDKASKLVGVDKALMYAMAKQESGFDPNAAAKTSSAKGLYQFIKGTWQDMVRKYGSKYPILRERGPEDPEANAVAGALFIKENSDYLSKNKIPVNATSVYAAHFLGPGGAKTLLTADPNKNAAALMPKAASANEYIFYETTGKKPDKNKPRTVQQVIDVLFKKVGQYQQKYAEALNAPSTGSKIAQVSKENKDLKGTAKPTNVALNNSQTIINAGNKRSTQVIHTGNSLDLPLFMLE
jgi:soluble lytic murein transglycosylase-like protein